MKKALLPAALLCFLSAAALAGTPANEPLPEELRLLSKKGIDAIYAVDIPEAEKNFGLAMQKYPGHPFPQFGIAMAKWANLEYLEEESDPKSDGEYAALLARAVADTGAAQEVIMLGTVDAARLRSALPAALAAAGVTTPISEELADVERGVLLVSSGTRVEALRTAQR